MISTEGQNLISTCCADAVQTNATHSDCQQNQYVTSTSSYALAPESRAADSGQVGFNAAWPADSSQAQNVLARNAFSARPSSYGHRQILAKSAAAYGLGGGANNVQSSASTTYSYPSTTSAQPAFGSGPLPFQPPATAASMSYQTTTINSYSHANMMYNSNSVMSGPGMVARVDPTWTNASNAQRYPMNGAFQGFVSGSSSIMTAQPTVASEATLNASLNGGSDKDGVHCNGCSSDKLRRKSGGWNDPPILKSNATSQSNGALSMRVPSTAAASNGTVATDSSMSVASPHWSRYANVANMQQNVVPAAPAFYASGGVPPPPIQPSPSQVPYAYATPGANAAQPYGFGNLSSSDVYASVGR